MISVILALFAVMTAVLFFMILPLTVTFSGFITVRSDELTGDFCVVLKIFKFINIRLPRDKLRKFLTKALLFREKRKKLGKTKEDRKKLARIRRAFELRHLGVNADVGTGDSALTAIITGLFYVLPSSFYAFLCSVTDSEKEDGNFEVNVRPDFEKILLSAEFDCIFSAKPVNIILNYITERKFML